MPFSVGCKNSMLDSQTFDAIRLHDGEPGEDGTANALGSGLTAATFDPASGGERAVAEDVEVSGLDPGQDVTHFSAWQMSGAVYQGSGERKTGDAKANAAGKFTLAAGSALKIRDPS